MVQNEALHQLVNRTMIRIKLLLYLIYYHRQATAAQQHVSDIYHVRKTGVKMCGTVFREDERL